MMDSVATVFLNGQTVQGAVGDGADEASATRFAMADVVLDIVVDRLAASRDSDDATLAPRAPECVDQRTNQGYMDQGGRQTL